jgi:hypothetical protein
MKINKFVTFNNDISEIVNDMDVERVTLTKIPSEPYALECVATIFGVENPDIYARWDFNYKEEYGIISLLNPPPIDLQGLVHGETLQAKTGEVIVRAETETAIFYTISTEWKIMKAVEDLKNRNE